MYFFLPSVITLVQPPACQNPKWVSYRLGPVREKKCPACQNPKWVFYRLGPVREKKCPACQNPKWDSYRLGPVREKKCLASTKADHHHLPDREPADQKRL